jgi:hypothetical protein
MLVVTDESLQGDEAVTDLTEPKFNLYKGGVGVSETDKRKKTAIHGIFGA